MAEKLMTVCDVCGKPAVETVTFRTSSGNRVKDYCAAHLSELLKGSRTPKRGRRPSAVRAATATPPTAKPVARKRLARKKVAARKTPRKKTTAKAGYSKNGKRLGRPPSSRARMS